MLSVLIALGTVFYEQQYLYQDNPLERQITVDSLLMVGPTVLMSLAVGVMVESLKRKEQSLRVQHEASIRDSLTGLYNYGTAFSSGSCKRNLLWPKKAENP